MKHLMYRKATIPRFETTACKTDVRNIYQGAVLGLVNSQVCLAAKPLFSEAALKQPRREAWVAVKELNLSYYIGETLLLTIYTHYDNSI